MREGAPSAVPIGLAGTTLAHGALVAAVLLLANKPTATPPVVYAVDLVAAPAPEVVHGNLAAQATPTVKKETAPIARPRRKPPLKATPKPPPKPPPNAKPVETPAVTRTPETPAPGETPSTGQDKVTVSQPGIQFPYPEYLRNIENRIAERWTRPPGTGALEADIAFVIHRDGSVTDIKFVKHSTSSIFDLNADMAIEGAANAHTFGPLPSGFTDDILPIQFSFSPKTPQ